MAWEAGRPADVEFDAVTTREQAAQVVSKMLDDLAANPDAWETRRFRGSSKPSLR
ncbi:hypothetical protein [Nocardioides speluncae]|uniref:hypothetical protein n=1 Tax=Nocardioides speluncae TaxID=2670337 RepID=UPI0012B1708F|nr:hypothetical protein [Nocardioides speluncae]